MASFEQKYLEKQTLPSLRIIVDGLNEVDGYNERQIIRQVQKLNKLKGIQVIIASRADFSSRYSLTGYRKATLLPLEDSSINDFFREEEWIKIKNQPTLHRLLRNPMMLTIYKQFSSVYDDCKDVEFLDWRMPVKTKSDLLHNYYVAQLALMMKRESVDGKQMLIAAICINCILPAIAYEYERNYCISQNNDDFRSILENTISHVELPSELLLKIKDYYREAEIPELRVGSISDILLSDLHLLHRQANMTFFIHQIYRDYLSAQWYIIQDKNSETMEMLWNERLLPYSIMEHIKNGSGQYWYGMAESLRCIATNRIDMNILVSNLISCFPSDEYAGIANYSNLDLRGIALPSNLVYSKKIKMQGAIIDGKTLGLFSGNPSVYSVLALAPDNSVLAAASNTFVTLFSMNGEQAPFIYNLNRCCISMAFWGNFLLVNTGILEVFAYEQEWTYKGAISIGEHSLTKGLREAYAKGDFLILCYRERYEKYHLSSCKLIEIVHVNCENEKHYGWTNLKDLRNVRDRKHTVNDKTDIVVTSIKADDLEVVSYRDGRLEVKHGDEIVSVLVKGVASLLDATISDNGEFAATLSFATFDGRRRIQLWDLNTKHRIREIYCDFSIRKIYLSDKATWLLGENNHSTWVYNIHTKQATWYSKKFVSNHFGKLATYGDMVLEKDDNKCIEGFNLSDNSVIPIKCPMIDPNLVCFLTNGSIAVADGNKLKFKSTRGKSKFTITPDGAKILYIQAFKLQPFIAVASENNRVSIYHTGTGQRVRKLDSTKPANIVVVHPKLTLIARSDGRHYLQTDDYEEVHWGGKPRGWWHSYVYNNRSRIDSNVLDLAFNEQNNELVVILSNGKIMFFEEHKCNFDTSFNIITSFNVDAYDFSGVKCTDELLNVIQCNKQ